MRHGGTQKLETERLLLRRFVVEDAEAMFGNWASDPEVTKYLIGLPIPAWRSAEPRGSCSKRRCAGKPLGTLPRQSAESFVWKNPS